MAMSVQERMPTRCMVVWQPEPSPGGDGAIAQRSASSIGLVTAMQIRNLGRACTQGAPSQAAGKALRPGSGGWGARRASDWRS